MKGKGDLTTSGFAHLGFETGNVHERLQPPPRLTGIHRDLGLYRLVFSMNAAPVSLGRLGAFLTHLRVIVKTVTVLRFVESKRNNIGFVFHFSLGGLLST